MDVSFDGIPEAQQQSTWERLRNEVAQRMTTTNLAAVTDDVLADTLKLLFKLHGEAVDNKHTDEVTELHWCIAAVQNEHARRTEAWIAAKAEGPATSTK